MESTSAIVGISLLVILGAPMLIQMGFSFAFTETILFRLALVLFVAYAIRHGPLPGLLALLAVFSLYIERSHLLLTALPNQKPIWPTSNGSMPIEQLPMALPSDDTHYYEPTQSDAKGVSIMERHGEQMMEVEYEKTTELADNIPQLEEAPDSSDAIRFYSSKGLLSM